MVRKWLCFLKKWSYIYADINISEDNLLSLPVEDSVYFDLQVVDGNTADTSQSSDDDDHEDDHLGNNVPPGLEQEADDIIDSVLHTSIINHQDSKTELDLMKEAIIEWPKRGEVPNDERNTSFLLSGSFPTLFPCSRGDVTYNGRVLDVSLNEAIKHYIKYYDTSTRRYPFAEHATFLHYVQNMDERHRINSQASVYINQNHIDRNLTKQQLIDLMEGSNAEKFAMEARMSRYGSTILGSPSYFLQRKKELLSLIDQKGAPHFWFTLSLPNEYWEGLQQILDIPINATPKEMFLKSPHIADEYFVRRAHAFFDIYFGKDGIERNWLWFRYEFQQRGNIHLHGMIRLNIDGDFPTLGAQVIKGRKSCHRLLWIKGNVPFDDISTKFKLSQLDNSLYKDYVISVEEGTEISSEDQIERLFTQYMEGLDAEKKILNFRDFFLTTENFSNCIPPDAQSSVRDPPMDKSLPKPRHPSNKFIETMKEGHFCLQANEVDSLYVDLVDAVQRHRHNISYCIKDGKCLFGFPRQLSSTSRLVVKGIYGKRGSNKGNIARMTIDFVFKSNDAWLNSHSKFALLAWSANLDMSVIVDRDSVVRYITKYCLKVERPSDALSKIVRDTVQNQQQDHGSNADFCTKTILRRTFNRITGYRDKCLMEICHLILSTPYVFCDHQFGSVNLFSGHRSVDINSIDNAENQITRDNTLDLYSKRMNLSSWDDPDTYHSRIESLPEMNLFTFLIYFTTYKRRNRSVKLIRRKSLTKPVVPIFLPDVGHCSEVDHPHFWKYCLVMLIREKPWVNNYETLYNIHSTLKEYIDDVSDDDKLLIINEFYQYFRNPSTEYYFRDQPFRRKMNLMIKDGMTFSEDTERLSIESMDSLDERDCKNVDNDDIEDILIGDAWNKDHDHTVLINLYNEGDLNIDSIKATHKKNKSDERNYNRVVRHRTDIKGDDKGSIQQREVVISFLKICGLWTDEAGNFLPPPSAQDHEYDNVLLVPGPAGTGKSFIIGILCTEIVERWIKKSQ